MEREPLLFGLGVDGLPWARRLDYGLSESLPFFADSNRFPAEMPLEVHVHPGIEVGILLSGGQQRHFQDFVHPVQVADVWLCGAWEPHGWRIVAPNTSDFVVMFLPEFLGEERLGNLSWLHLFAVPPSERPRVKGRKMRDTLLALGHEMQQEIKQKRAGWESAVRLDLLRVLLTLSRGWQPPARSGPQRRVRASNLARIMPALVLVNTEPAGRVTLAQGAKLCGLSRAQFSLIFRDTMGLSFGKFCLRARLALASRQLLSSDQSVESIAEASGFSDGSHLHHSFVKYYGCTPAQYRERGR